MRLKSNLHKVLMLLNNHVMVSSFWMKEDNISLKKYPLVNLHVTPLTPRLICDASVNLVKLLYNNCM